MHQQRVNDFMARAGQNLPALPVTLSEADRLSRAKLILEEAFETVERGLGVRILSRYAGVINFSCLYLQAGVLFDMLETVDGCCDLRVVTTGTLSACGVGDKLVQEIVDLNNLEKFGPGGYRDEHGKWIKPPDFIGPTARLYDALVEQGWKP